MPDTAVRKTRTISLRISETEFESLKALYAARGARSVSDLIRSTIGRLVAAAPPDNHHHLELRIQEIDGKLSILDGEVARLNRLLRDQHESQV